MKQDVTLIATAAMGLESIVGNEVKALGYDPTIENGSVYFQAPLSAIARCNLWLRTADRVKMLVGQFTASTFDELFEGTKSLPWEAYISEDGVFPVQGKSIKSTLYSVPDCQAITKKAIAERLKLKFGIASKMPETGSTYKVEVSLAKDVAELTLDTSGAGLHKRGYRVGQGEAPLKETLAAALVRLTNWRPHEPFIDPFCGSGTIPIEAALIGQNIAPGFNRSFDSQAWTIVTDQMWNQAFEEAEDLAQYDQPLDITGSDIDHNAISTSKKNAMESGLSDLIKWKQMQVNDLSIKRNNGYIVTNPPYGERMSDKNKLRSMYSEFGKVMQKHPTWSIYVLTAFPEFENRFGKTATKKRKLFNGFIRADYYQFFGNKA